MAEITITFLGTGPSPRIPRPGCDAPACRDAERPGSKSRRLQSSVLIEHGDTAVLFDASEDVLKEWGHVRHIRHLNGIFISHPHRDAMGGIPQLDTLLEKLDQDHVDLYAEPGTAKRILHEYEIPLGVSLRPIARSRVKKVGALTVKPFRVEHTGQLSHPTLGFAISAGTRQIVLMSDVKRVPAATLKRLAGPDLCILDCALHTGQFPNHVNFSEAQEIVAHLKPKKTYLTQIGVEWPPFAQARRIARSAGNGIDMAYDGLRIIL